MCFPIFGQVPEPGALAAEDRDLLDDALRAYDVVGEALAHSRFRAGITEAMRIVGRANQYIAAQEPWKLAKDPDQAERLATVLWTALQVVSDANTLLTPYLPASAQQVHETLGRTGEWAAMPRVEDVVDDMPVDPVGTGVPEKGRTYPVITGEYTAQQAHWGRTEMVPGTPLAKPTPIFAKLDPELAETGPEWAPIRHEA